MSSKAHNTSSWFCFQGLFLFPVNRSHSHLANSEKGSRTDRCVSYGQYSHFEEQTIGFSAFTIKHFLLTKCRIIFTFESNTSLGQAQWSWYLHNMKEFGSEYYEQFVSLWLHWLLKQLTVVDSSFQLSGRDLILMGFLSTALLVSSWNGFW